MGSDLIINYWNGTVNNKDLTLMGTLLAPYNVVDYCLNPICSVLFHFFLTNRIQYDLKINKSVDWSINLTINSSINPSSKFTFTE